MTVSGFDAPPTTTSGLVSVGVARPVMVVDGRHVGNDPREKSWMVDVGLVELRVLATKVAKQPLTWATGTRTNPS